MRKMTKKEVLLHFIQFGIGFIVFCILIMIIRKNKDFNYDIGVLVGFITGCLLIMSLLFLAKYLNLREKEKFKLKKKENFMKELERQRRMRRYD